jgi:hypothetical protein
MEAGGIKKEALFFLAFFRSLPKLQKLKNED